MYRRGGIENRRDNRVLLHSLSLDRKGEEIERVGVGLSYNHQLSITGRIGDIDADEYAYDIELCVRRSLRRTFARSRIYIRASRGLCNPSTKKGRLLILRLLVENARRVIFLFRLRIINVKSFPTIERSLSRSESI